jgi:DNA-binding beta-propeller fold protein YncE
MSVVAWTAVLGLAGVRDCPANTATIETRADCESAALAFIAESGFIAAGTFIQDDPDLPLGCFSNQNRKIKFNQHADAAIAGVQGLSRVCIAKADALGAAGIAEESVCVVGTFFVNAGSGVAVCASCPDGKYGAIIPTNGFRVCAHCPAGKHKFSDVCIECPLGRFGELVNPTSLPFGCTGCPAGKFQPHAGKAACSNCPLGKYTASPVLHDSCAACGNGLYMPAAGWPGDCVECERGRYRSDAAPAPVPPAYACQACPTGKYHPTTGPAGQHQCDPCPVGQYATPMGGVVDTIIAHTGGDDDLNKPSGVAYSKLPGTSGALAVADKMNHQVRVMNHDLSATVFFGIKGMAGYADGSGLDAQFNTPTGVAFSPDGRYIAVADSSNHRVRRIVVSSFSVFTIAGNVQGDLDGVGSSVRFSFPIGLSWSPDGLFIAVADRGNNRIKRVTVPPDLDLATLGDTITVAGDGTAGYRDQLTFEPGGVDGYARFNQPTDVSYSPDGDTLAVCDQMNHHIRRIDLRDQTGGPELNAVTTLTPAGTLVSPTGIDYSPDGLFLVVSDSGHNCVRTVIAGTGDSAGATAVLAGNGFPGYSDGAFDSNASNASFNQPAGVAWSPDGTTIALAGENCYCVRRLTINTAGCRPSCDAGKYADEAGCTDCPLGKYQSFAGQASCSSCAAGKSGAASAQVDAGTACTECVPGQFSAGEGGISCTLCKAGKYQRLAGQASCSSCAAGKSGAASAQVDADTACTECVPGQFSAGEGGISCTLCSRGRFQADSGKTTCDVCRVNCAPGQVSIGCSGTNFTIDDSKCQGGCTRGLKAVSRNSTSLYCDPQVKPGPYSVTNFSGSARTFCELQQAVDCEPCSAGKFQPEVQEADGDGIVSSSCEECPAGKYSGESAGQCTSCIVGMYQTAAQTTSCTECGVGRFGERDVSTELADHCAECEAGKYQQLTGEIYCLACPPGKHQPDWGALTCATCHAGQYSGTSAAVCTACEQGKLQSSQGEASCSFCPVAKYQPSANSTACLACTSCPSGIRIACAASSEGYCTDCTPGRYISAHSNNCSSCGSGRFSIISNTGACVHCPNGKYQALEGQPYCDTKEPCARGTYEADRAISGLDRCAVCPINTYTSVQNAENCTVCPAGQFQEQNGSRTYCEEVPAIKFVTVTSDGQRHQSYCPTAGIDPEFTCRGGILLYKPVGFWHDGLAPQTSQDQSSFEPAGGFVPGQSTLFYDCPTKSNCAVDETSGAITCMQNSTGILCAICVAGFTSGNRNKGGCEPCPPNVSTVLWPYLLLVALACAAAVLWMKWARKRWADFKRLVLKGRDLGMVVLFKLCLGFFQVALLQPSVFDVRFPDTCEYN